MCAASWSVADPFEQKVTTAYPGRRGSPVERDRLVRVYSSHFLRRTNNCINSNHNIIISNNNDIRSFNLGNVSMMSRAVPFVIERVSPWLENLPFFLPLSLSQPVLILNHCKLSATHSIEKHTNQLAYLHGADDGQLSLYICICI